MNATTTIIWLVSLFLIDGTVQYIEEMDREKAHQRALKEFAHDPSLRGVSINPMDRVIYH